MGRAFEFASRWTIDGPTAPLFDRLVDVADYPSWWPQVRDVRRVDARTVRVRVRSALPYDLDLVLTRVTADRDAGRLRVDLAGDLRGWAAFDLRRTRGGTVVDYHQEVVTAGRIAHLPRALDPVLRANHAWMMRGARRGLGARAVGGQSYDRVMPIKPAETVQTAPLAALGLLGGFVVARESGIRALGGVVLGAAGLYAGRTWLAKAGPGVAGGLAAVYLGGFGASHPLAKKVGPWPAVFGVAAGSAAASYALCDRLDD